MIDYGLSGCVALITGANNPQGFRRRKTDKNSADRYFAATAGNADAVKARLPYDILADLTPSYQRSV